MGIWPGETPLLSAFCFLFCLLACLFGFALQIKQFRSTRNFVSLTRILQGSKGEERMATQGLLQALSHTSEPKSADVGSGFFPRYISFPYCLYICLQYSSCVTAIFILTFHCICAVVHTVSQCFVTYSLSSVVPVKTPKVALNFILSVTSLTLSISTSYYFLLTHPASDHCSPPPLMSPSHCQVLHGWLPQLPEQLS